MLGAHDGPSQKLVFEHHSVFDGSFDDDAREVLRDGNGRVMVGRKKRGRGVFDQRFFAAHDRTAGNGAPDRETNNPRKEVDRSGAKNGNGNLVDACEGMPRL